MQVEQELDGTDSWQSVLEAKFLLAARGQIGGGGSVEVNPLAPTSDIELAEHARSEMAKERRRECANKSLLRIQPTTEVSSKCHSVPNF